MILWILWWNRKSHNIYKDLGILNLSYVYESGRHEMLNEINKDEVIGDIITWLTNNIKN